MEGKMKTIMFYLVDKFDAPVDNKMKRVQHVTDTSSEEAITQWIKYISRKGQRRIFFNFSWEQSGPGRLTNFSEGKSREVEYMKASP